MAQEYVSKEVFEVAIDAIKQNTDVIRQSVERIEASNIKSNDERRADIKDLYEKKAGREDVANAQKEIDDVKFRLWGIALLVVGAAVSTYLFK